MARKQKMYGLKLGRQGRIVIPVQVRKALGLKPGDTLVCRSEGRRVILRAQADVEQELWKAFANVKGSMAEELIAERRREAKREAEE